MGEDQFYDQSQLWGQQPEPYQVQVQADVLDMLPHDVQSVLDVGCGDGYITNHLPEHLRVVGADISPEALKHVRYQTEVASICQLPFADNSFDLVMTNDVLEHLPDEQYRAARRELARVAKKYILVTVPHNEQLETNYTKCAECKTIYHVNWHQRSYTEREMLALFEPPFQPVEIRLSGDQIRPPWDPTVSIRHEVGCYHAWEKAVCPSCSSSRQIEFSEDSLTRRVLDIQRSLAWGVDAGGELRRDCRTEIMGLYSASEVTRHKTPKHYDERSDSVLNVDFSNPLQAVSHDFVRGSMWSRFTLPAEAKQSRNGIRRRPDAPDSVFLQVKLPISSQPGDRIYIEASGAHKDDAFNLYSADGLLASHVQLIHCSVNQKKQIQEVTVTEPWRQDRFGLALEIQLFGNIQIHSLRYEPSKRVEQAIPFVLLETGHNVIRQLDGGLTRSWGFLASAGGYYPAPILGAASIQETAAHRQPVSWLEVLGMIENCCATLTQKAEALTELCERREQHRASAEQSFSSLQQDYQNLEEQLETVCKQVEQKEEQRSRLEEQYAAFEREYKKLEEQFRTVQEQLEQKEEQLEQKEEHRNQVDMQLTSLQLEHQNLAEALEDANRKLEEKEEQRDAAERVYATLQQEYQQTSQELILRTGIKGGAKEIARNVKRKLLGPPMPVPQPTFLEPWKPLAALPKTNGKRLRVLILSHMFPHPDQPSSGPFVHEQVRALCQHADVDARVLVGRPFWMTHKNPLTLAKANRCYRRFHESSGWLEFKGVLVKYLPYRIFGPFLTHGWSYRSAMCRGIEELHKEFPFDVVHAHTAYTDGSAGLAIAKRFSVPLLITAHTGPFSMLMSKWGVRHWTLRSIKGAAKVIAVSSSQSQAVVQHVPPKYHDRFTVLPNVVDTELFHPPQEWKPNPSSPRILFVGYFVPIKRLPLLLEAFSKVTKEIPGARLKIVGGGETPAQDEELSEMVHRFGLGQHIEIMGYKSREAIARIIREDCDLLVLSSKAETFGCVLTEALACGKPVVSTRCGGPEDIVTEDFLGTLTTNGSPDNLARAIIEVASNLKAYSPQRIRKHVEKNFSCQAVARKIAELYRQVTQES